MRFVWLLSILLFGISSLHCEEGVIESVNDGVVTFHTLGSSYEVKMEDLSSEEQSQINKQLSEAGIEEGRIKYSERVRIDLNITGRFTETAKNEKGFRPDCNEIPTSADELMELANNTKKDGMVDFLQNLPEGSMQVYTMVFDTKSKQHHGVSPMNPRIIRSNADGSITMSYVCDPTSQDYGKVEMMYFDQEEERFKLSSINFSNESDEEIETDEQARYSHLSNNPESHLDSNRVNKNPKSCLKCHSNDPDSLDPDPRALWDEYQTWPGAYGSEDDSLDSFYAGEDELENLVKLKEKMKGNPCFEALPDYSELPAPTPEDFGEFSYSHEWLYPYSESFKSSNYDVRPNLRLAGTLPRFAARRLGRKFFEQPGFEDIKFAAVMSSFNCPQISDYDSTFEQSGPSGYDKSFSTSGATTGKGSSANRPSSFSPENQRGDFRDYRELFKLGAAYGFKNSDWTSFYNDESRNGYHSPSSQGGHADGFADLVQGDLMRRLAGDYPQLEEFRVSGGDLEDMFGARNFCVEETTAPIRSHLEEDKPRIEELCKSLDSLRLAEQATPQDDSEEALDESKILDCFENQNAIMSQEFEDNFVKSLEGVLMDQDKYDRGEGVAGTCIRCHSDETDILTTPYSFFNNEQRLREEMRKGPELMNLTRQHIDSGRMPKGIPLEDDQKEDFLYYMEMQYLKALQE
jgi:hypothetical protein